MQKLIFIDPTSMNTHLTIKNRSIGASEYQFYNLIEILSKYFKIKCFYNGKETKVVDDIEYDSLHINFINTEISNDDVFIIQRFLPDLKSEIYNKIKNNKIYIWNHDLIAKGIFYWSCNNEEKNKGNNDDYFKSNVLNEYFTNKNINYIFVSKTIKNDFKNFTSNYGYYFENNRLHYIYNILYEDEFLDIKNSEIKCNKYLLTYASALHKGIEKIIPIFDKLLKLDNNFILQIMTPGYEWAKWQDYLLKLKNQYGENIIIVGPVDKLNYAKNIKESLCVFSGTFYETFGCVFAESYYLETPVIADNRSGAVKEIIDNNYIMNYDNYDNVIEKILYLKNNRDEIKITLDEKFMLKYNLPKWIKYLNKDTLILYQRIVNFQNSSMKKFENQILTYVKYIENKDILDIGSNIGLISYAIAKNINYKSLHLFEPNPHYINYSKQLLKNYKNIYFNNCGVGNINENKTLYCSKNENIGWNTFLEKDPLQSDNFIYNMNNYLCKIVKLDDYYQNIDNIDFIKIDVEGYEGYAIEGAFELIKKFKPYIYVEVGWGTKHPYWKHNETIYNKLFDLGYSKVIFSDKTEDILFEPTKLF